jgi:rubrerythrin
VGIVKTDDNLKIVLQAVASASVKFLAYAEIAEQEGYHQVARLFRAMAETQKVYSVNSMKIMNQIGKTDENLSSAIDEKTHDFTQLYPTFIEQANQDGNPLAATAFQAALNNTKNHVKMLNAALENLGRNKEMIYWACGMCGNLESGDEPVTCKICGAAREKFIKVQ